MRIVLTGATGTIGGAVAGALRARGDEVVALARDARRAGQRLGDGIFVREWPEPAHRPPADAFAGADAVVHLLGEPVVQRCPSRAGGSTCPGCTSTTSSAPCCAAWTTAMSRER